MASLYKNKDRRILKKLRTVIDAVKARDAKAADTTKMTTAISTRTLMFDPTDTVLKAKFDAVDAKVDALLVEEE